MSLRQSESQSIETSRWRLFLFTLLILGSNKEIVMLW